MSYEEAIIALNEMKGRFRDGFSFQDKAVIEQLHRLIFNKELQNKGCSDCFRDAYTQIMIFFKKNSSMPKPTSNYVLKGGAIIKTAGSNRFYANPLPNDDVAELHLAKHPDQINLFASYPSDWEERIARRQSATAETNQSTGLAGLSELYAQIETLQKENANLRDEISSVSNQSSTVTDIKSDEVETLKMELASVKAELECANAELEELRAHANPDEVQHESDSALTDKPKRGRKPSQQVL